MRHETLYNDLAFDNNWLLRQSVARDRTSLALMLLRREKVRTLLASRNASVLLRMLDMATANGNHVVVRNLLLFGVPSMETETAATEADTKIGGDTPLGLGSGAAPADATDKTATGKRRLTQKSATRSGKGELASLASTFVRSIHKGLVAVSRKAEKKGYSRVQNEIRLWLELNPWVEQPETTGCPGGQRRTGSTKPLAHHSKRQRQS